MSLRGISEAVPISKMLEGTPSADWIVPAVYWDAAAGLFRPRKITLASISTAMVNTLRNGAGAPGAGVGLNGDFYLQTDTSPWMVYGPKAGGVWPAGTFITTTIRTGAGAPGGGLGIDGDSYIRNTTGDFYVKSGGVWALTMNLVGPAGAAGAAGATGPAGASYAGTSATNVAIGTGAKAFTTQAGLAYQVGNYIRLSSSASPLNFMEGTISTYVGTALTINCTKISGSGSFADWVLSPSGSPGYDYGNPSTPTGGISLSSTSIYPTADQIGATNIYYHARGGGRVPVWNSVLNAWEMLPFTGAFTMPGDSNAAHVVYNVADRVQDIWAFKHPTTGLLQVGIGGSWSSYTVGRGVSVSDITLKDGIWVNTLNQYVRISAAGDVLNTHYFLVAQPQATYLGSVATIAAGVFEDSQVKRLVWNAYNTRRRSGFIKYPGGYNYNGALRQVGGVATYQIETLAGVDGVMMEAFSQYWATCSVIGTTIGTGVLDTAGVSLGTVNAQGGLGRAFDTTGGHGTSYRIRLNHGLGRKVWKGAESASAATTAWLADNLNFQNGLSITLDDA